MSRRLFVVEDRFEIRGRGLVLVPGINPEGDERFRVGERIALRKPDGTSVEAPIGGLEIPMSDNPSQGVLILLKTLTKEDVPAGTEVWSCDG
jgi:hypothetical protein